MRIISVRFRSVSTWRRSPRQSPGTLGPCGGASPALRDLHSAAPALGRYDIPRDRRPLNLVTLIHQHRGRSKVYRELRLTPRLCIGCSLSRTSPFAFSISQKCTPCLHARAGPRHYGRVHRKCTALQCRRRHRRVQQKVQDCRPRGETWL
ncbi:hypothetical protein CALCODRAFT_141993 [Calocera cornea HHB12733]|uniref:Uncharacterized protein n=1 Tax=Calocera cornea HHB12733 TaxID=1353952 RepID=A0A165I595_9BASI|nr:hypothetical protein CALCODRAFT_141993 [Calocera cornea HHB12733]